MSRAVVRWPKAKEAELMEEPEYLRLMTALKDDSDGCRAWRKVVCEGSSSDCDLNPPGATVRGFYARNVAYDRSVNDPLRFGCDQDTNVKVGVLVYNRARSHILLVSSYGNRLGLPKGSLDLADADPMKGASRELHEETGFTDVPLTHIVPRDVVSTDEFVPFKIGDTTVFLFHAMTDEPDVKALLDVDYEIANIGWYPIVDLARRKIPLNRFTSVVIDMIMSGILRSVDGASLGFS